MITRLTENDFVDAFRTCDRLDQFSREGLHALYEHLEECAGAHYELDVIELCCDYYESSAAEIIEENGIDIDPEDLDALGDWLNEHTSVVAQVGDGFLYAAF